jgi:IPT/TIG domain-containing protein
MSLKRFTRRAAGIGVGVALLMLGLEAPAMAATTVTAISPTSGPADCVVDITGTGLAGFEGDGLHVLNFVAPDGTTKVVSTDWFAISSTEIWAAVPTLVVGTNYTAQLTDPSGVNTAGGTFLSTGVAGGAAGGCAPTIASFTPVCGSVGTVVTITGTNLLSATNLSSANSGGNVFFSPDYDVAGSEATQPVPDLSEPTSISAIVPSDAADGAIEVATDVDANAATAGLQGVFSTTDFQVPPPDCAPAGGHARSITLKLRRHLVAKGKVSLSDSTDTFTDCIAGVPVKIQRRVSGHWKTVGKATTGDTGRYSKHLKNKHGKYRSKAPAVTVNGEACNGAKSRVVTY